MVLESADTEPFIGDSSHMNTTMKAHREQDSNKLSVKQKLWLPAKATGAWDDALEMQAVFSSAYNYITFIHSQFGPSHLQIFWSRPPLPISSLPPFPHSYPPQAKSCAYRVPHYYPS